MKTLITSLRCALLGLLLTFTGCGGGIAEYKSRCSQVDNVVSRVRAADSRLQKAAETLLQACGDSAPCRDAVIDAYTPIAVLIGSCYGFAESLQRGGVCSTESVTYLNELVEQIEEIERAITN